MQLDDDGPYDPAFIPKLLAPVLAGETDFALGSRFHDVESYRPSFSRRLGILLFRMLVSILIGRRITDPTSICKPGRVTGDWVKVLDFLAKIAYKGIVGWLVFQPPNTIHRLQYGGAKVSTEVGSEGGMPGTPVGLVKKLAQTQTPTTTFVTHWLLNCSHVLSFIACVGLKDVNSAG